MSDLPGRLGWAVHDGWTMGTCPGPPSLGGGGRACERPFASRPAREGLPRPVCPWPRIGLVATGRTCVVSVAPACALSCDFPGATASRVGSLAPTGSCVTLAVPARPWGQPTRLFRWPAHSLAWGLHAASHVWLAWREPLCSESWFSMGFSVFTLSRLHFPISFLPLARRNAHWHCCIHLWRCGHRHVLRQARPAGRRGWLTKVFGFIGEGPVGGCRFRAMPGVHNER